MLQGFALETELAEVERRLEDAVYSDEPLLREMALHTIGAGGKRVRPLSAILAFRAVEGPETALDGILDIAVGLELIHSATLIHDDINDGAKTRRGRPATHHKYGQGNAIIAGDFLFTKGFQISGRFDRTVVDWTAEACRQLAEGEVMQARFLNDPSIGLDDYLLLVRRKTASFIQTGTRIGAYLGGAPPALVDAMADFGLHLGIAFQIIDDVLDVVGDGDRTGKRVGLDIKDGNTTIPALLALRRNGPGSESLRSILAGARRDEADVTRALEIIRGSGAIDEAKTLAHEYGARARQAVRELPSETARTRMEQLVDLVLDRDL